MIVEACGRKQIYSAHSKELQTTLDDLSWVMGSSKILGSGEPQSEGLIVDARRTNCSHTKCASWRFNPQIDPLKKVCHIERGKEHAFLFFCRSICESSFEKLQKIREAIFFRFKIPKIKLILL